MDEQKFKISGFHCEACVKLSTVKIGKIEGVHNVEISKEGDAKICAAREIAVDEISKALDGLGYAVAKA